MKLGAAPIQLGRFEKALVHLERSDSTKPRDLYALYYRGCAYLETGRPYIAKRCFDEVLSYTTSFSDAEEIRNRAKRAMLELDEAVRAASKAAAERPADVKALSTLAILQRRAGRLEKAVELLGRAVAASKDDPRVVTKLALILCTNPDERIRDGARAVDLAERAVRGTGGSRPEPIYVLAAAHAETGNSRKHDRPPRSR